MTDYSVDPLGVGDPGTTVLTSIWEVNELTPAELPAGSTVRFKRGAIWRERLIPPTSGTPQDPIVYTAYGSGDLPKIWADLNLYAYRGYGFIDGSTEGYTPQNDNGTNLCRTTQEVAAYAGDWCLKMKRVDGAAYLRTNIGVIQEGETYYLSCMARKDTAGGTDGLHITVKDDATGLYLDTDLVSWTGTATNIPLFPASDVWEDMGFEFTVPTDALGPRNYRIDFKCQTGPATVYIDSLYCWLKHPTVPNSRWDNAGTFGYTAGHQLHTPIVESLVFENIDFSGPMENGYWDTYSTFVGNHEVIRIGGDGGPDDIFESTVSGDIIIKDCLIHHGPSVGCWISRGVPGVWVYDCEVNNHRNTGLYQNANKGCVTRCHIHHNGNNDGKFDRGGIGIQGGSLEIYNNELNDNGSFVGAGDHNISCAAPFGAIWIIGNYIHDVACGGIQVANDRGDVVPHTSYHHVIAYNIVENFGQSTFDRLNPGTEQKTVGIGSWSGIRIGGTGTGRDENECYIQTYCTDVEVYNNVVVNGSTTTTASEYPDWTSPGIQVSRWDNRGVQIKNNIFLGIDPLFGSIQLQFNSQVTNGPDDGTGDPPVFGCENTGHVRGSVMTDSSIDHNIFDNGARFYNRVATGTGTPVNQTLTEWQATANSNEMLEMDGNSIELGVGQDMSDVFTLTGSGAERYKLKAGSPGMNAGDPLPNGYLPMDHEGNIVYHNRNIGAYANKS